MVGIGWSPLDAGGETADTAHPCLSSPYIDFFSVLPIKGNWGGKKLGNRWSMKAASVMFQPRWNREGIELKAFVPYSNCPVSPSCRLSEFVMSSL